MAKERQLKGERKVWAQKPKPSMSPSLRQGNQGTKRAMPAKLQDDVKAGILPRAREAKAAAEHREFSPNSNAQEVKAEMLQHIREASNSASSHHRVQAFAPSQSKRAKVASSEQMKGLSCLTEEEKARLVTVPECLEKEIGLKFHKHSNARQSVKCFFERYLQIGRIDHYWETKPESVPGQRFPLYRSKLRTPSLFNQTFEGQPQTPMVLKRNSLLARHSCRIPRCWKLQRSCRHLPPESEGMCSVNWPDGRGTWSNGVSMWHLS